MSAVVDNIVDRARATLAEIDRHRMNDRCRYLKAQLRTWEPIAEKRTWLQRLRNRSRTQYRRAQLRLAHHFGLPTDRFDKYGALHTHEHELRKQWVRDLGTVPPVILFKE